MDREVILDELAVLYRFISKFRLYDEFRKDIDDIKEQICSLQEMLANIEGDKNV